MLDRARGMLSVEAPVAFAHRYITRPADVGGENHVALSRAEFALRRAHGLFAYHWQAHGNDYGIGREIDAWRAAGLTVVVSGSREHYEKMAGSDPGLHPVLITAALDKLQARLSARGRETAAAAASRLARSDAYTVKDDPTGDHRQRRRARCRRRSLRQAARHTSLLTRRPPPSVKRARAVNGRPAAG